MQPKISKHYPLMAVIIFLLFMSLSGFVIIGAVTENQSEPDVFHVEQVDNLAWVIEFWKNEGFMVNEQSQTREEYEIETENNIYKWVEVSDELLLVPLHSDKDIGNSISRFADELANERYNVQLSYSNEGTAVGFSKQLPNLEIPVVTNWFIFKEQTPVSYNMSGQAEGGEGNVKVRQQDLSATATPRLAIVIDDWGYDSIAVDLFLDYPFPLTHAVLPYLPESEKLSNLTTEAGYEVILHQPMEPNNSLLDMGPGGLVTEMSEEEIRNHLVNNLQHLPVVTGVNNHMGSKVTADYDTMKVILETLRDMELFFLDSLTSSQTVTKEVAAEVGIPYAINNIFLDNINDLERIKQQIRSAIELAKTRGEAIAIGHVRVNTAKALWEMIPEIIDSEIELVFVSQLLKYPDLESQTLEEPLEDIDEHDDKGII